MNEDEEWVSVPFNDLDRYQVNRKGEIRSFARSKTNPMILKPSISKKGYLCYGLKRTSDGKSISLKAHKIVATAFIPNPENKPMVDHINGDKKDNRVENLRWATAKENANNPATSGSNKKRNFLEQQESKRRTKDSKPVEQYDFKGNKINEFKSISEASRMTGIYETGISNCCHGSRTRTKLDGSATAAISAGGYQWKFKNDDRVILPIEENRSGIARRVRKYDLGGNYIETFDSFNDACRAVPKACPDKIRECCEGTGKTSGGFQWRYEDDHIDSLPALDPDKLNGIPKPVIKCDPDTGEELQEFSSFAEVTKSIPKTCNKSIKKACINGTIYVGFKWKFKE